MYTVLSTDGSQDLRLVSVMYGHLLTDNSIVQSDILGTGLIEIMLEEHMLKLDESIGTIGLEENDLMCTEMIEE